jgi:hypothetical protein
MGLIQRKSWELLLSIFALVLFGSSVNGEDPYKFFTWNITYGIIYPLGVPQQVIYYSI